MLQPPVAGRSARVALEVFAPRSTVFVFGAGHISREIAALVKHVGFRVVVLDDRALFLDRAAFPDADELVVVDFADVVGKLPIDRDSYLVIVTRGHQHDRVVLEQALRTSPRYVGMIGSRSKVATIKAALRDAGFAREALDAVHAPIGIRIAAHSPEEIAVSIVAELINVRGTPAPG
jgi:xanthine dehydrogenase accessory factor